VNAKPAIIFGEDFGFARVKGDVSQAATYFRRHLSASEKQIAITLTNPYWHWVATLALLRLGLACASVAQARTLSGTISRHFDLWIGDENPAGSKVLPFSSDDITPPDTLTQPGQEAEEGQPLVLFGEGARRLILTSGTTGTPKIISLTAAQIEDRARDLISNLGLDASTRFLSLMGSDTIGGFAFSVATWLSGGSVMFGVPVPGTSDSYRLPYKQCNLLLSSPDRLKSLLNQDPSIWDGREQRRIIVGGSRLSPSLRNEALRRACVQLDVMYGSTEAGSVAYGNAMLLDRHPGAVGYVADNVQLQLVDAQGQPVQNGLPGAVRCKTSSMPAAYEYLEHDDAFRDGWFYPGDEAIRYDDGLLAITGRVTDILNLGGTKISAVDLETQIQQLEGVQDVCAVVVGNPDDQLAIVVVCDNDTDMQALRSRINDVMISRVPYHLVGVGSLSRNAMGKLPRNLIVQNLQKMLGKASQRNST
jgi:acyl-coenzyme A synthetase/AMP-(fatty) acid ligase